MIEAIDLRNTGANGEGVRHAGALANLNKLSLPPAATPTSVGFLKGLAKLETLYVPKTWDDAALAAAKRLLAETRVERDDSSRAGPDFPWRTRSQSGSMPSLPRGRVLRPILPKPLAVLSALSVGHAPADDKSERLDADAGPTAPPG